MRFPIYKAIYRGFHTRCRLPVINEVNTRMSMELSSYLVSWVVTYLGDLEPTYIGVIVYLLSTMDILVE